MIARSHLRHGAHAPLDLEPIPPPWGGGSPAERPHLDSSAHLSRHGRAEPYRLHGLARLLTDLLFKDGGEDPLGLLELVYVFEGVPAGGQCLPECPAAPSRPRQGVHREAVPEGLTPISGQEGPGDG